MHIYLIPPSPSSIDLSIIYIPIGSCFTYQLRSSVCRIFDLLSSGGDQAGIPSFTFNHFYFCRILGFLTASSPFLLLPHTSLSPLNLQHAFPSSYLSSPSKPSSDTSKIIFDGFITINANKFASPSSVNRRSKHSRAWNAGPKCSFTQTGN